MLEKTNLVSISLKALAFKLRDLEIKIFILNHNFFEFLIIKN